MTKLIPTLALAVLIPGTAAFPQDCGGEPTEPPTGPVYDNFDDDVDWLHGGCSDVSIYSRNSDDTLGLFFSSSGQVATVQEAEANLTFQLDLASDEASVVVQAGEYITDIACNDVVIQDPIIDEHWTAISGTAQLSIDYDENGGDFDTNAPATLILFDVMLVNDVGDQVHLDHFGPAQVYVGWLPG